MKLALIDLDNVVCDPSARFQKAEEAKAAYLVGNELPIEDDFFGVRVGEHTYQESDVKRATTEYWKTAFTPDLVKHDTLIDGVSEALLDIQHAEYKLMFLTSRPESMREATETWLVKHTVFDSDDELIMKPASQQYVKTITWKSGVVELLVRLFNVDDLMVIDDEVAIQEAIAALDLPCDRKIGGSLQEAVAMLKETV